MTRNSGRRTSRTLSLALAGTLAQCGWGCAFELPGEGDRAAVPNPMAPPGSAGWRPDLAPASSIANLPPSGRFDALAPRPATTSVGSIPTTPPRFRKTATRHLGQWTGRAPNRLDALGLTGTDLGIGFPHRGELWFLFGDSLSVFDWCADSIARTRLGPLPPDGLPELVWSTSPSGLFAPIRIPGIDLGFMNVPVEAVSIDDRRVYLFVATQWSDSAGRHAGSALAHSDSAQLDEWVFDHSVETHKFVNVSVVREGAYLYVWGSGEFRRSDVYLARVPVEAIGDRGRWEYFRGFANHGPDFGPDEASARPVVSAGCVGELSVRRHPRLGLYLLAYNCDWPRGVQLRTAEAASGPYSEAITLFEPWHDAGYEHFIHIAPELSGRDDGLSDMSRESDSGGEYGPYLVPEWFSESGDGRLSIVYTLSSWNPYQVHVMETSLVPVHAQISPALHEATAFASDPGLHAANLAFGDVNTWRHEGDGFTAFETAEGGLTLSSRVEPLGGAATGTLWRDFRVDGPATALEFEVRGGDADVLLIADDEVVRRVRARSDRTWRPVIFRLATLRGRALRLALYDRSSDEWGFVAIRGLRLL